MTAPRPRHILDHLPRICASTSSSWARQVARRPDHSIIRLIVYVDLRSSGGSLRSAMGAQETLDPNMDYSHEVPATKAKYTPYFLLLQCISKLTAVAISSAANDDMSFRPYVAKTNLICCRRGTNCIVPFDSSQCGLNRNPSSSSFTISSRRQLLYSFFPCRWWTSSEGNGYSGQQN